MGRGEQGRRARQGRRASRRAAAGHVVPGPVRQSRETLPLISRYRNAELEKVSHFHSPWGRKGM